VDPGCSEPLHGARNPSVAVYPGPARARPKKGGSRATPVGENIVSHFLGPPQNSRHLWVASEQAALSPAWSIHCGCGTAAYKFIWAMGGENQTFDDMDKVGMLELK